MAPACTGETGCQLAPEGGPGHGEGKVGERECVKRQEGGRPAICP